MVELGPEIKYLNVLRYLSVGKEQGLFSGTSSHSLMAEMFYCLLGLSEVPKWGSSRYSWYVRFSHWIT